MSLFGNQIKDQFEIEPGYTNVNHASFGQTPKEIIAYKTDLEKRLHQNPDRWFRYDVDILQLEVRKQIAAFVNADLKQCFMVQSATEAFNSIIKSLVSEKVIVQGDIVLINNCTYGMVVGTLKLLAQQYGIIVKEAKFSINDLSSKEGILNVYRDNVRGVKLAIFDYISSIPSIKFPIKDLIDMARQNNVIGIVDAAHAIGISQLSIKELNPDFFFSNLHKWCFVPQSCTLLYISQQYLNKIHHVCQSTSFGKGIEAEFDYTGTQDRTSYLCAGKGIDYINRFGLDNIIRYCEDLAWEAANLMTKIWGTELQIQDRSLMTAMVSIRAPDDDINKILAAQKKTFEQHVCYIVFYQFQGQCWSRISAAIYNDINDFRYAATRFLQILNE